MQESGVSKAVKSLVTLSTILLCCLIVTYHAIEVQVSQPSFNAFIQYTIYNDRWFAPESSQE